MRCEVCGREIFGNPLYRVIEGGKLTVCGQCAQFSQQEWDPANPQARKTPTRRRSAEPRRRSDIDTAENMDLIEGYGMILKRARQKKGISIEDFSKQIREKESVVKKLEKENMNPPMNLVKKLQDALGVKILEESAAASGTMLSRPMGPRTLGDMIKIKDATKKE
jgi:putative transcription factor